MRKILVMLFLSPALALAAAPDYTALTTAVDFSGVVTAVLAVAALGAAFYVTLNGVKKVIHFVRGI